MDRVKKNKRILPRKLIIAICLMSFTMLIFVNKVYAKDNYRESDEAIIISITTDRSSYSNNDDMSVKLSLTNYDNQFNGNITTMIIELDYDSEILTPYIESVKNIVDKKGSMAFSHVDVSKKGNVVYQYVDVEEPLPKENTDVFSVKFKVNSDINTTDAIKSILKTGRVVIQDGSGSESVRYVTNIQYKADTSAKEVANDDTIGLKEYNSVGDLLSEDEQKNIQKEAIEEKKEQEKKEEEKKVQESNNKKKSKDIQDKNELTGKNDDSSHTSKKNNILQDLIIVIAAIILIIICFLLYKNKKNSK